MPALNYPQSAARRTGPAGWSGRTIVAGVVGVFALFFAIPIVWLLVATTKSAHGLIVEQPLRPGGISDLAANWQQLFGFQDGAVTGWVANSAMAPPASISATAPRGCSTSFFATTSS